MVKCKRCVDFRGLQRGVFSQNFVNGQPDLPPARNPMHRDSVVADSGTTAKNAWSSYNQGINTFGRGFIRLHEEKLTDWRRADQLFFGFLR